MTVDRLLWLEDQQTFFEASRSLLGSFAASVKHCPTAGVGIEVFLSWQPEVVLLDLRMPPGTWGGINFLEAVKRDVHSSTLIVLSGADSVSQCLRALDLGADAYLEKEKLDASLPDRLSEICHEAEERRRADDYRRATATERNVHRAVMGLLRQRARLEGRHDIFAAYVPKDIALKTYERRLDQGSGAQEDYLDLIDLRKILDAVPQWPEVRLLDSIVRPIRRSDRTTWLVELNEMRKIVAHPVRGDLTLAQRKRLRSIETVVASWMQSLSANASPRPES